MNKLPIYEIIIDELSDQGVNMISLVDSPAIQVDFIKLANEEVNRLYFAASRDKQLLYGPFLIPNQLIYRYNEQMGEYYVKFSADSIEMIADKFNEDLNNRNINFQHSDVKVDGYVSQNWIIGGDNDKSNDYGFTLPQGTWFGGVKVKDQKFWEENVKTDIVKGFSVEIKAELALVMSKNKQKQMEDNIELAVPATPADNTAPADNAAPADTTSAPTRDEMMQMIDVKFQALNDEILAIRAELDKMNAEDTTEDGTVGTDPNAPMMSKIEELTAKVESIEEKMSNVAGVPSIKKDSRSFVGGFKAVGEKKMVDKFEAETERIRSFANRK